MVTGPPWDTPTTTPVVVTDAISGALDCQEKVRPSRGRPEASSAIAFRDSVWPTRMPVWLGGLTPWPTRDQAHRDLRLADHLVHRRADHDRTAESFAFHQPRGGDRGDRGVAKAKDS